MRRARAVVAAAAISVMAGACAPAAGGAARQAPSPHQATVQVTNNNWSDMRVYMLHGSQTIRLGTVSSMQTTNLRLPPSLAQLPATVRLLVRPMASTRSHVTPFFQVRPGQRVEFQVENHLPVSSLAVW